MPNTVDATTNVGHSTFVSTDLLLLNATNLPWRPIFPYAFVQVSAIARRNGLSVRVVDMLDVPQERWQGFLATHLERHRAVDLEGVRLGGPVPEDDAPQPRRRAEVHEARAADELAHRVARELLEARELHRRLHGSSCTGRGAAGE